jgi:hypothetical protein
MSDARAHQSADLRGFGLGDRSQVLFQERGFLPRLLKPDLTWSNSLFPFGPLPEGFFVIQNHRTSLEAGVVLVPFFQLHPNRNRGGV